MAMEGAIATISSLLLSSSLSSSSSLLLSPLSRLPFHAKTRRICPSFALSNPNSIPNPDNRPPQPLLKPSSPALLRRVSTLFGARRNPPPGDGQDPTKPPNKKEEEEEEEKEGMLVQFPPQNKEEGEEEEEEKEGVIAQLPSQNNGKEGDEEKGLSPIAVAVIAVSAVTKWVGRLNKKPADLILDNANGNGNGNGSGNGNGGKVSTVSQGIIWEQSEKDVKAEQRVRPVLTNPGFSFSAAGLLFPYHLGVSQCLIEKGYITESTPLAGSSAGALVCAVIASGLNMQEAMAATKELCLDCRTNGTTFRLGAVLRLFLERFLPADAHIKSSGRIRVAVTQVFRSPRGLLVDQFDSKEDLINALHTSCFFPLYLAPKPVTRFRNRVCIDGGFTLFMPPTASDVTVRVCAFPTASFGLKGIGISPDCNPSKDRASVRQLLNWALDPVEDELLDDLFNLGYKDAMVWVNQHNLSEFQKPILDNQMVIPR